MATLNCSILNSPLVREYTDILPESVAAVGTQPKPDCNIEYFEHAVLMLFEIEVESVAIVALVTAMERPIDIVESYLQLAVWM